MRKEWLLRLLGALLTVCVLCATLSACSIPVRYDITYAFADRYLPGDGSYDAENVEKIVIIWISGDITLIQSEEQDLSFSEDATDLNEERQMHTLLENGVLYVQFCASGYSLTATSLEKDLTVEIPAGIELELNTVSGSVNMDGVRLGNVRMDVVSAAVTLGEVTFDSMLLYDVSGGMTADVLHGEQLYCSTVSGTVQIKDAQVSRPWIETVSGDVSVGAMTATDFEIYTTSGEVSLTMTQDTTGTIDTVSGNVVLVLPEISNLTVRYESVSGELISQRSCTMSKIDEYAYGNGAFGMIAISTTSGNVEIR